MHLPYEGRSLNGGTQKLYRFPNGYGASLVQHSFSYGLEMAVIKFDKNNKYKLCYDTPITDDVIGGLDEDEVQLLLNQIAALPAHVTDPT